MKNTILQTCLVAIVSAAIIFSGCSASNTVKGGAVGATAGGVIGGVIGNQAGNTALGAIIGAAIGGAAGVLIGKYMDDQAAEIQKDIEGARVERVGEGIKITFDSGILFATGSAELTPTAKTNISKLATILQKYDDTNILIEGHTDSVGATEMNQKLSERRAASVTGLATSLGVVASRFQTVGYGENQPIAPNSSAEGRQQNRRVEVAIFANDDLKDAAEKGKL